NYDIDPGSLTPKVSTMLEFNLFNFNSRVFPGIDPMVVRLNDRVRIRMGNLTMTSHPIHIHGHEFVVAGTDGGWIPPSARWPEVTVDVAVGQMRAIEFDARAPGDWAFHCHKSHHTMNAMGHNVPTMMSGQGPYGSIEMGGMFTTVKIREGIARDDYKDPGWYRHPTGTQAYALDGAAPAAERAPQTETPAPKSNAPILNLKKGNGHA